MWRSGRVAVGRFAPLPRRRQRGYFLKELRRGSNFQNITFKNSVFTRVFLSSWTFGELSPPCFWRSLPEQSARLLRAGPPPREWRTLAPLTPQSPKSAPRSMWILFKGSLRGVKFPEKVPLKIVFLHEFSCQDGNPGGGCTPVFGEVYLSNQRKAPRSSRQPRGASQGLHGRNAAPGKSVKVDTF